MKRVILLLLFLSYGALADCVDATTIPANYTDSGADVLTSVGNFKHVLVLNTSDTEMCICWKSKDAASCSDDLCLPAGSAVIADDFALPDTVFVKYDTGAATTGKLCTEVW